MFRFELLSLWYILISDSLTVQWLLLLHTDLYSLNPLSHIILSLSSLARWKWKVWSINHFSSLVSVIGYVKKPHFSLVLNLTGSNATCKILLGFSVPMRNWVLNGLIMVVAGYRAQPPLCGRYDNWVELGSFSFYLPRILFLKWE